MTDHPSNSSVPNESKNNARGVYNPITREDLDFGPFSFFEDTDTPFTRGVGLFLFVVCYLIFSRTVSLLSPLLLVILLACVLYRLDTRERRIAAIPLTFSTMRLAWGLAAESVYGLGSRMAAIPVDQAGVSWLPLFLAAYLFLSPRHFSHTSRVIFWESLVYLLAGFLPIAGFLVISEFLNYGLFFALAITLILDLAGDRAKHGVNTPARQALPAHS